MKKYFNDLKDIYYWKKFVSDFPFWYRLLLYLPLFLICTIAYIIIVLFIKK